MTCPNCNGTVANFVRNGFSFNACTMCGGLWLSTDEMDKLLSAEKLRQDTRKKMQAPSISPYNDDVSDAETDAYDTYYTYKYHGCYGRPRSARWAQRMQQV